MKRFAATAKPRLSAVGALRIERDGDVLRVTLARPETRNAFDAALIAELAKAFVDVGTARAVVLAARGRASARARTSNGCARSVDLDLEANVADANALRRMLEAIDSCPAPVVALVQGHALGGGIGLVACSDIVIAEPDAVFAFSEVKLGIVPAVISPFALRKIGESAARRLLRHRRALRRGDGASDRPRPRGDRRPRRCARARPRASCGRQARGRPGTRSDSCSTGPTAPRRRAGSRSGGPATRDRKGSARSWSDVVRPGRPRRSTSLDLSR